MPTLRNDYHIMFYTMLLLLVYILPFVLGTSMIDFDPAWTNWPLWSQVADKCSLAGDYVIDYFVGILQLLSYLKLYNFYTVTSLHEFVN